VHGDNSPGIWCYLRALDGGFDPADLQRAIKEGRIPVLKALKKKGRTWEWNYAKAPLRQRDADILWKPKLKHCHILEVCDRPSVTARQRAMRNLAPINYFVFPNGNKHFDTTRVGWTERPCPSDLGESPRVIAWVQHCLVDHLGPEGSEVYQRYLHVVGGRLPPKPPDGEIQIRLREPRSLASSRTSPGPRSSRQSPTRRAGLSRWSTVLGDCRKVSRARILSTLPNAQARLDRLRQGLTVEQFVGLANALYNKCDPRKLREAAPSDLDRQAELAWGYLEDARQRPRLGGRWAACVTALRPSAERGLAQLHNLSLDEFVCAMLNVVSKVYRKVEAP